MKRLILTAALVLPLTTHALDRLTPTLSKYEVITAFNFCYDESQLWALGAAMHQSGVPTAEAAKQMFINKESSSFIKFSHFIDDLYDKERDNPVETEDLRKMMMTASATIIGYKACVNNQLKLVD